MSEITIESGRELKMENVLSIRKKMTNDQLQHELIRIGQLMEELNLKKNGGLVTSTFALEMDGNQQIMDVEVLVPMDREVKLPSEYTLKKDFRLVNALYSRFTGDPRNLSLTLQKMADYIQENKLMQLTGAYNVQVNDFFDMNDYSEFIMDVYIGVSENLL